MHMYAAFTLTVVQLICRMLTSMLLVSIIYFVKMGHSNRLYRL